MCLSSCLCVLGEVPSPLWTLVSLSTEKDADSDELKGMKCFVTNTSQMSRIAESPAPRN